MVKRVIFCFTAAHEILLLKEKLGQNPTSAEEWGKLAVTLNSLEVPKFAVNARSCRERVDRLIMQFKAEDLANLRK